jgi:hypothetical protein
MKNLKAAQLVADVTRTRIRELKAASKKGNPALQEAIVTILIEEAEAHRELGYMTNVAGDLIPCLPQGHPMNSVQKNAQAMLARLQRQLLID